MSTDSTDGETPSIDSDSDARFERNLELLREQYAQKARDEAALRERLERCERDLEAVKRHLGIR